MSDLLNIAKPITEQEYPFEFSICTLVTRKTEYEEMLQSFLDKGFNQNRCEFLYADNIAKNNHDAFSAINQFFRQAKGKYIIICHQDILINKDSYTELKSCLKELDEKDPTWGVCGNAGAAGPNYIVYHISYPDGSFMNKGNFPLQVTGLDENFLLIKNSANLKVSNNLDGFHLYGTDLVLQAELNGYSSYVIPFNLIHKSRGNRNEDFFRIRKALIKKYSHFFRSRWVQTNSTVFHLSGSLVGNLLGNPIFLFFLRMWNGLKKRAKS
ncbi:hypothetical protein ACFOG5_18285 [Pedobacter fastidiosus]|uniref:Acyl esterase n=1 Tax=Pedobacter fastidiosus TaxID=2765361 RepID=A0ABR7KSE8_9SPHI|nr:acyl esterase [Pedobacter fastidiosus]MBC6111029.1 acyl esterase [Pedobacter fastidiosus]